MKITMKNAVSHIANDQSKLVEDLKTQDLGDIFDLTGEITSEFIDEILDLQKNKSKDKLIIPPTLVRAMNATQLVNLYNFFNNFNKFLRKNFLDMVGLATKEELKKLAEVEGKYLVEYIQPFNNELLKRGDISVISEMVEKGVEFCEIASFEAFLGDIFNPQIPPFLEEVAKVVKYVRIHLTIPPNNGLEYGFKKKCIRMGKTFITTYNHLSRENCGVAQFVKNIVESVKQAQQELDGELLALATELGIPPSVATITPKGVLFADGELFERDFEDLIRRKDRFKRELAQTVEGMDCSGYDYYHCVKAIIHCYL